MVYIELNEDEFSFDVSKGTFTLPLDPSIPIICIGPGTGVAPMRSIIKHFLHYYTSECILFYGCRNENADYLYRDEWEKLTLNSRFTIVTAFSRDQPEKIYVQHKLLEHSDQIWQLLQQGAHIYLSGNAKRMPEDVMKALIEIMMKSGGHSEEEATKALKALTKTRRFQQECWS